MLTITSVVVGCIGLLVTLTLLQVSANISLAHLVALAAGGVAFLLLSAVGMYELMQSQPLRIGTLCGAFIILLNIAQLVKRRYTSLFTAGPS
ncbi:hypothetical protein C1S80_28640 [Mycolicibacterium aubagnense]|nr:hypothetical protein C1S80_28640 [Mycolicibacterium aubagnense]